MLELVQMKFLMLSIGEGRNNFIVEYNENREEDNTEILPYDDMTSF